MPTQTGNYPVTFTISNSFGSNSHTMTIIIEEGGSDIIVTDYNSTLTLSVGQNYDAFQFIWIESTLDVKYYADKLPYGLKIDETTGKMSGKADEASTGVYEIVLKNDKSKVKLQVNIIIEEGEDATIIRFDEKIELEYYHAYYQYSPMLCSGKGLTYKVDKDLPKDLIYDTITGKYSGQVVADPQAAVTYTFTCTSANQKSQSKQISISVVRADDVPVIVSKEETLVYTVGDDLVNVKWFVITGTGLKYYMHTEIMGVTLDENTGIVNGYPTEPLRGQDITFEVFYQNGAKSIKFEINFTVKPVDRPVVPDSTVYKNVSISTGSIISQKIFDVVGDDVSIASIDPPLPSGFTLSSKGYLQGLAVSDVPRADYKITFIDANGATSSVTIPLEFVSMKCPAQDGYDATAVGETAVKKCGGSKTGFIIRKCITVDGKAVWQKEIDECESSNTGALVGIIIGCIIGGGIIFLGSYCIYVRLGGTTKHVRKTAEQMVESSKDTGVRI